MNEHPILFSGEMVRAILESRKTQTRRVIGTVDNSDKFVEMMRDKAVFTDTITFTPHYGPHKFIIRCAYGKPGDRLWVRETWQHVYADMMGNRFTSIPLPNDKDVHRYWLEYAATPSDEEPPRWKPSIFMPRWASRITLEIINVRVEKVQEISRDNAFREGVEAVNPYAIVPDLPPGFPAAFKDYLNEKNFFTADPVASFRSLWDSLNAKRGFGWKVNPWVWVIEFKRILP